jgi:hypothetical protein
MKADRRRSALEQSRATRSATMLLAALLAACGGGSSGGAANPAPAEAGKDEPRTITVQPRMTMTVARYAPGESRYAIDRVDTLTVQYPNAAQTQVVQRSAWVRLSIAPGLSSAQVLVILDSVRGGMLSRDSLRLADGSRWTGQLIDGRLLQGLAPSQPNAMAEELVGGTLAELLMPLPVGGARGGFSWRDTVQVAERVAGAEIPTTAIRDVNADVQQQPTEALRLSSTAALDGKGRSTRFGGDIGVVLTGTRTRVRHLSQTGQLLAVEGRDSLALMFDVSSVGQTVPATQIGHVSIQRISGGR